MPHHSQDLPLGKSVSYPQTYDAALLFPISRAGARQEIGLASDALPFEGWDLWNAYEMSWLNANGLPQVALLRIKVPCTSPNIIESKSFKLYLNSFNQTRFDSHSDVLACLQRDLSEAAGATVSIEMFAADQFEAEEISEFKGINIDGLDVSIEHYEPNAELLTHSSDNKNHTTETLFSRLLKSNCPVTQQPDWACVQIQYTGLAIDQASLLKYIVSFRMHNGFHENCVERIFVDIMQRCHPETLSVFARYTRRGGLDINPWRATPGMSVPSVVRSARQ
jgi:7-cyano-7-deazaguanine reductase